MHQRSWLSTHKSRLNALDIFMYSTLRSKIGKNGVALLSFTSQASSIPLMTWLNLLDGSCTLDTAADSWDTIRKYWSCNDRGQQSWTLNENNRGRPTETIALPSWTSRTHDRIRELFILFFWSLSLFQILLINSKFSIFDTLQHAQYQLRHFCNTSKGSKPKDPFWCSTPWQTWSL